MHGLQSYFGTDGLPKTVCAVGILLGAVTMAAAAAIRDPDGTLMEAAIASGAEIPKRQYTFREAVGCYEYWTLCMLKFLAFGGYQILNPIILTLGLSRGLDESQAVLCVSLTGIASSLSRLLCPILADKIGNLRMLICTELLNLTLVCSLAFARSPIYVVCVILVVACYGCAQALVSVLGVESFGTEHSGPILGFTPVFNTLSSFIFPSISAAVYMGSGDYSGAFLIGSAAILPVIIMLSQYERVRQKRMRADKT